MKSFILIFAKLQSLGGLYMNNPFVTNGYVASKYFCDRETETEDITTLLLNGNNIALISPRRYGKTDLIRHSFSQLEVAEHYYTFIVDIYATRSLRDFVNKFGKVILDALKPRGRKVWETFVNTIASLQAGITYDIGGVPSWNIGLGDIATRLLLLMRYSIICNMQTVPV
jgi:hypothetical protein